MRVVDRKKKKIKIRKRIIRVERIMIIIDAVARQLHPGLLSSMARNARTHEIAVETHCR